MTMFVRAIEGFIGRIVILLVAALAVFFAAYHCADTVCSGIDISNQLEGFWFQLKLAGSNIVEFFVDIYDWSMGR